MITKTLRFTILARDGFECVYCHTKDKPLEVDHVRSKALGGTDSPENLVAACADCNRGKSAGHLAEMDSIPRPIMMQNAVKISFLEEEVDELKKQLSETAESEKRFKDYARINKESLRYAVRMIEVLKECEGIRQQVSAIESKIEINELPMPVGGIDSADRTVEKAVLNRQAVIWRTKLRAAEADHDQLVEWVTKVAQEMEGMHQ